MHKNFDKQIIRKADGQYYKIFVPSCGNFGDGLFGYLFLRRE